MDRFVPMRRRVGCVLCVLFSVLTILGKSFCALVLRPPCPPWPPSPPIPAFACSQLRLNVSMDTTSRQFKDISPTRTRETTPRASPGSPALALAPAASDEEELQPPTEALASVITTLLAHRSDAEKVMGSVAEQLGFQGPGGTVPRVGYAQKHMKWCLPRIFLEI